MKKCIDCLNLGYREVPQDVKSDEEFVMECKLGKSEFDTTKETTCSQFQGLKSNCVMCGKLIEMETASKFSACCSQKCLKELESMEAEVVKNMEKMMTH